MKEITLLHECLLRSIYHIWDPTEAVGLLKTELAGLDVSLSGLKADHMDDDNKAGGVVQIAFVLCGLGHRLEEAETMIKSAILHSETDLHFTAFVDQEARKELWPKLVDIVKMAKNVSVTFDFRTTGNNPNFFE